LKNNDLNHFFCSLADLFFIIFIDLFVLLFSRLVFFFCRLVYFFADLFTFFADLFTFFADLFFFFCFADFLMIFGHIISQSITTWECLELFSWKIYFAKKSFKQKISKKNLLENLPVMLLCRF